MAFLLKKCYQKCTISEKILKIILGIQSVIKNALFLKRFGGILAIFTNIYKLIHKQTF